MKNLTVIVRNVLFNDFCTGNQSKKITNRDYTEYFAIKKDIAEPRTVSPPEQRDARYANERCVRKRGAGRRMEFYDKRGKLYFQYDYGNKAVTYLSDTIKAVDKFYIKTDSVFEYTTVDRPPLYLNNEVDIFRTLSNIRPPNIQEKNIKGKSVATFEIDPQGNVKNIQIEQSLHLELDKYIVENIGKLDTGWLPAIKDGTPVTARYILIINVLPVGDKVPKEQKLPGVLHQQWIGGSMTFRR